MKMRYFRLFLLLSAISLFIVVPQPFMLVFGTIQAFMLPGLVFTFFVLNGRLSLTGRIILSILISPLLLAALTAAVNPLVDNIYTSSRIVLSISYILLFATLFTGRQKCISAAEKVVPKQIFILSFLFSGLILLSYLLNDYLLIRSDSWYHAAVIQEVANRGIPPGEPLIADYPLMYMWFYHLFQSIWMKLSGLSLFNAMGAFNIINAFIYPYVIARFTLYFTDRKWVVILATILAMIGLDAVSWIFWPVALLRALTGEVTGMEEIRRIISQIDLNGVSVIYFLTPKGAWNLNFSDKFLTITIFNYSLNLFMVAAIISMKERLLDESRVRSALLLFVIILGVFLFHLVTGITLLFTVGTSIVLMYLASRFIWNTERGIGAYIPLLIALLLIVPIAGKYFLSLVSQGSGDESNYLFTDLLHVGFTSILTIVFPLLILFFPAREAFRELLKRGDQTSRMFILWVISILILCVFINIGTVGEKKFLYFIFLIIAPPICVQIIEKLESYSGIKRFALVSAVAILFFVPPILTFRGFIIEEPVTEEGARRDSLTDEDMRFFEWVENNTSKDDVIIENNVYHLTPVYAGRRNLYSWYYVIRVMGYGGKNLDLYREIHTAVFGEEDIPDEVIDKMREFPKKLYVAVWQEDIDKNPDLAKRFGSESSNFKQVYNSDRVSLYTLEEGR